MEDALISNFHTHKQTAYNITFLTLLLPIFNSNLYRFCYYQYYLQKASPDHIFKILGQLLLTVSNPKNLANISKCLFTHFYSFVYSLPKNLVANFFKSRAYTYNYIVFVCSTWTSLYTYI